MQTNLDRLAGLASSRTEQYFQLGSLVGFGPDGTPFVTWNANEPLRAQTTVALPPPTAGSIPQQVLLLLGVLPQSQPIIVGVLQTPGEAAAGETVSSRAQAWEDEINGRRILLNARDELTLRCGRSSVTLTRGGRIVMSGSEITSRASGPNKIRGARVDIN
jgi:hypothetical protein